MEKYWFSHKVCIILPQENIDRWDESQQHLFGEVSLLTKDEIVQTLINTNRLLFGLIPDINVAVDALSQSTLDSRLKGLQLLENDFRDLVVLTDQ